MDKMVKEQAMKYGCHILKNDDLLALILGGKTAENDARIAATMDSYGIKSLLKEVTPKTLQEAGCTKANALKLTALAELVKRMMEPEPTWNKKSLYNADEISDYYRGTLSVLKSHEEIHAMYFNANGILLREETLTSGNLTGCVMDQRRLIKHALSIDAHGVVIIHNHPSGNISPSAEDEKITKDVIYALEMCDIRCLDHIIVSDGRYFSFRNDCEYLWDDFKKNPYKKYKV